MHQEIDKHEQHRQKSHQKRKLFLIICDTDNYAELYYMYTSVDVSFRALQVNLSGKLSHIDRFISTNACQV